MKREYLVFANNESRAKNCAIELREKARAEREPAGFLVRGIRAFVDVQADVAGIILLDPAPKIEAAYEELNASLERAADENPAEERRQIEIIREFGSSEPEPGLIGSSVLPDVIEYGDGVEIALGELVSMTQYTSGLSAAEWNALEGEDREARLQETIETLEIGARTPSYDELLAEAKALLEADKQPASKVKSLVAALGGSSAGNKEAGIAWLSEKISAQESAGQGGNDGNGNASQG